MNHNLARILSTLVAFSLLAAACSNDKAGRGSTIQLSHPPRTFCLKASPDGQDFVLDIRYSIDHSLQASISNIGSLSGDSQAIESWFNPQLSAADRVLLQSRIALLNTEPRVVATGTVDAKLGILPLRIPAQTSNTCYAVNLPAGLDLDFEVSAKQFSQIRFYQLIATQQALPEGRVGGGSWPDPTPPPPPSSPN